MTRSGGSPWDTDAPVASTGASEGDVTLIQGHTFCISNQAGDMAPDLPHGLFFRDTRVLSKLQLSVNGQALESVGVWSPEPFGASFATRSCPTGGHADAELVVFRHRDIGLGMRERLLVTNFGLEASSVMVDLICEADFADLFAVKENRVEHRNANPHSSTNTSVVFEFGDGPTTKRTTLQLSEPAVIEAAHIHWEQQLQPGETWKLCVEVSVEMENFAEPPRFRCDPDDEAEPSIPETRLASWRTKLPEIHTDNLLLATSVGRSSNDLGALRIFNPDDPGLPVVAAGAPWFMTLFGRDSLLTSWMTLLADASLASGVLQTLARFQGDHVDDLTEEQPGKILHEMRFASSTALTLGGGSCYYGSVDATPLFVMLLGELSSWGLEESLIQDLLPHADRALEWIEQFGDRDGDGYVEYERLNPKGLVNQGWKDSWDAIRFADGTLAQPPIALCEVQGYVYAAYLARAQLAVDAGDHGTSERYRAKAAELRRRFNQDFWLDSQGTFALGLDADKRPIDAVTSNVGHCLWTGIIAPERARTVADRLFQDDLFSGWGIRTLATSMAAYNPISYHNGSVWPHDNAICAAGLARYGFREDANRIVEGQLAAAAFHGGQPPELFAGFSRAELPVPGRYPAACSPQAWSAAAPLMWLRTLLGLNPRVPDGKAWLAPELPASVRQLSVHGIELGAQRLDVDIQDEKVTTFVSGEVIDLINEPRPLSSAPLGDPGRR